MKLDTYTKKIYAILAAILMNSAIITLVVPWLVYQNSWLTMGVMVVVVVLCAHATILIGSKIYKTPLKQTEEKNETN